MYHNNISERVSTRVHHAPGGRSSLNIFGGPEPVQNNPRTQRKTTHAAPVAAPLADSTNRAPASASTSNIDLHGNNKSSTRLHHAPGGRSQMGSLIFGGEPAPVKRRAAPAPSPITHHHQQQQQQPITRAAPVSAPAPTPAPAPAASGIMGGFGSNHRRVDNDIHSKPSTRVHHAPGGRSSFNIFGGQAQQAPPSRLNGNRNSSQIFFGGPQQAQQQQQRRSAPAPSPITHQQQQQQQPITRAAPVSAPAPTPAPAPAPAASGIMGGFGSNHRRVDNDIHSKPSTRVHHAPGGKSNFSFY